VALPPLTPDQRAAALEKAAKARKDRAEVKNNLKRGSTMPGVGKVRARQIMERLGIAESRRVRGLGANQRSALENEFGGDL
jgi:ribosomal protein S13